MIELLFTLGSEVILVVINGNSIMFGNTTYGAQLASIKGLKLSREGVEQEFPDLKGKRDWREVAIERFKRHVKSLPTEDMRANYIIDELRNHGYVLKQKKKQGRRVEKFG